MTLENLDLEELCQVKDFGFYLEADAGLLKNFNLVFQFLPL